MSACCLKCNSNGVPMAIMANTECCLLQNVTMHGSTITTMVCYYGIVEFSVSSEF